MKMINMRLLLLIVAVMTQVSCSLLSPVKTDQPNAYVLNTVPDQVVQRPRQSTTILVAVPDTRPVFDTTKMAYTTKLYRVGYFSQNQWAETPSQMLLPLMTQTLQNTHLYRAVLTPPYAGRYDYVLNTQITQLQQNYTRKPALLQFSLRANIISMTSNQVIASKQFSVTLPIKNATPYNGVLVANKAVSRVLAELAQFCTENTRG
jgi:cholesterol transport system auxiliary component